MIMGVGMKELIRLIGKRCTEEAKITEEIWELTWGICREIIITLAKKAKNCEKVVEEEIEELRKSYGREMKRVN